MVTDTSERTVFAMPSLGADMTEGRITEWLVQPGDQIERGQIVVIVETDKSDIEVEVFESATVVTLLVGEGEMVAVGTPIAELAGVEAAVPGVTPAPVDATKTPDAVTASDPPSPPQASRTSHVTSPVIRHLADQLHVEPEHIHGTGPGGRVQRADVQAAAARPIRRRITPRARRLMHLRDIDVTTFGEQHYVSGDDVLAIAATATGATPQPAAMTKAEKMRRHIADLMTLSWAEIPHFHVTKRLDLGAATERLAAVNEQRPLAERVVPGALLLCAAARAAAKVSACNGWWRDGVFAPAEEVRLGVVLSLRTGGIIVPTIDGADRLSPIEMMNRLTELVQRARQGRLRASDMAEATITVTNLGDLGADAVSGIIHPPQVAIVGFGAIHDEVLPIDGVPATRTVVYASLAGDHRAIDGLSGSRYLAQLHTLVGGPLLEEL